MLSTYPADPVLADLFATIFLSNLSFWISRAPRGAKGTRIGLRKRTDALLHLTFRVAKLFKSFGSLGDSRKS